MGILVTVCRLITKCENEPKLCDPIYSFTKAHKIYGNNQFAETTENPGRPSWCPFIRILTLNMSVGKSMLHACHRLTVDLKPQRCLGSWSTGFSYNWPVLPCYNICRHTAKPKKQHNCSGRPVKPPVPSLPKFYLQLVYKMTYKLLLFKQWIDNKIAWTFTGQNCSTKIKWLVL